MAAQLWYLVVACLVLRVVSQQRWYYTNVFRNNHAEKSHFPGFELDFDELYRHPASEHGILYAGGLMIVPFNVSESQQDPKFNLNEADTTLLQRWLASKEEIAFSSVVSYRIFLCPNYHKVPFAEDPASMILQAEIGLFDHRTEKFVEKHFNNLSTGTLHAAQFTTGCPQSCRMHKLMWSWDPFGRSALLQHTWETSASAELSSLKSLRIMTYNLWHHNPASWVYPDGRKRWKRYEARLDHFAAQIAAADPDVIAIQEVRQDSTFTSPTEDIALYARSSSISQSDSESDSNTDTDDSEVDDGMKADSGHQLEHLLTALRRAGMAVEQYQLLYHPAMLQVDRPRLTFRHDEGLLVLSKLPLRHGRALFLPRSLDVKEDDHQRLLLLTEVQVAPTSPSQTDGEPPEPRSVTIGTSHFALHRPSRDAAVQYLLHHLSSASNTARGGVDQEVVLLGDFNAEPQEDTLQLIYADGFIDAWTHTHPDSGDEQAEQASWTFPACRPVKRIDYVLYRPSNGGISAREAVVLGQAPTADTEHLVNARPDLGMLDLDSPLYASDHFAVQVDFELHSPQDTRTPDSEPSTAASHDEL